MSTIKMLKASLALALMTATAGAAAAQETLAIRGGTVHPVTGPAYVGTVVAQDGVITEAGPNVQAPAGATIIDATGLHVYPGLFDAATRLGLTEIGAVDVTNDYAELGNFTPHLQTRTAVHPASEHIPVARANGITHTVAIPGGGGGFGGGGGGGFNGQGSLFSLDGWTIEEMEIDPGVVMVMSWPTIQTRSFNFQTFSVEERSFREARREYDEAVAQLTEWLDAARNYDAAMSGGATMRPDLRLEALARVTRGELPVLARVGRERDIRNVVEFAEEQGIRLILGGAVQGYRVADMLAEKGIPVLLGSPQSMPSDADASYDEPYANPGKLHAAGVKIAFATYNSSSSRLLPYDAAMAVPYGLPRDEALRAITINAAEMLGVDDRLGSIETGKIANLIVTDSDPLVLTTELRHLVINGREVGTMNRHRELFQKHSSRPMPPARDR